MLRYRAGLHEPDDEPTLFEKIFIGLYSLEETTFGRVEFFDVDEAPPRRGRPAKLMSLEEVLERAKRTYEVRNRLTFEWADHSVDTEAPVDESEDD